MSTPIQPIRIELSLGIMFQSVNVYLVPGEQLTLIDCGLDTEDNWKTLNESLQANGYQVSDIEQVIITHEHRDHVGLLPKILDNSQATIRISKLIEPWFNQPITTGKNYLAFKAKIYDTIGFPDEVKEAALGYIAKMRDFFPEIDTSKRFAYYKESDTLNFGRTEWEVLNTPGHCPTQFVFVQEEEQRIFSSDMLLPIAPMPIIAPDPETGEATRSLKQLINSFERLRAYDFQTVYPGHGPVFENANAMMDKQLARIEMRKNETYEAIQAGLNTPYKIAKNMYPYHQIPPNMSGVYMVIGYVDLLEEEGRIRRDAETIELEIRA